VLGHLQAITITNIKEKTYTQLILGVPGEIAGLNAEKDLDISKNSEQEEIRRIKNAA
jgi:hypothetical protein